MTAETTLPVVPVVSKFQPHSLHVINLQTKLYINIQVSDYSDLHFYVFYTILITPSRYLERVYSYYTRKVNRININQHK
jgi:hypothetical protein